MRKLLVMVVLLLSSVEVSAFQDPYDVEVLSDTPVAYWRLNDLVPNGGTALDISGNSHNGTYGSASGKTLKMKVAPAFATCGFSKVNDGFGTQQQITVPDDAAFDLGTGDFTIEMLWQTAAGNDTVGCSTNGTVFSKDTSTGGFPYIRCQYDGVANGPTFQMCGDSYGPIHISHDVWHQLAFVRQTTTTFDWYVDGALFLDDLTISGTCDITNAGDLKMWYNSTIGGGDTSTYTVKVDNVSFYNTELSAGTISDHYDALFDSVPCPQMPDMGYQVKNFLRSPNLFGFIR